MYALIYQPCDEMCRQTNAAGVQKEKEDLEDISNELELADEEAMIPYFSPCSRSHHRHFIPNLSPRRADGK